MSRIYFHTEHEGETEVYGTERAHMGCTITDLAFGLIPDGIVDDALIYPHLLPELHDEFTTKTHNGRPWPAEWPRRISRNRLRLSMGASGGTIFHKDGVKLDTWSLQLNTALAVGSDALCLFAKLHGQCEIHAWVEGPDRAWMADVIQQGRDAGLYREGVGWEKLQELLRAGDEHPVVTSYSVCESFPSYIVGDWLPKWPDGVARDWRMLTEEQKDERSVRSDAWYELTHEQQWAISMRGLREQIGGGDEGLGRVISPETLRTRFNHGISILDLFS